MPKMSSLTYCVVSLSLLAVGGSAAGTQPQQTDTAVELASEVGRNKSAPAGVSSKLTGQMPETVVSRPYSGLRQILNSTPLTPTPLPEREWLNSIALQLAGEPQPAPTTIAPTGSGKPGPSGRHKPNPTQMSAKPKLNGLAQSAVNAGIVDCAGRIQQMTDYLTTNSKSGAYLFISPAEANRHIASTSLEIQTNGVSSYATASFAPGGNSGCGSLYETVSYWANRCDEVASKIFPNFPAAGKLGASIGMLDGGPYLRVFLMPTGQGCLSIKKEMVY